MEIHPGQTLAEISPNDKPWDRHRIETQLVAEMYQENLNFRKLWDRVDGCSWTLQFGEVSQEEAEAHDRKIKLQKTHFCRVRLCPVCGWRKSLAMKARFLENWEQRGYRQACENFAYIHIVFTVKNPEMNILRETVQKMNKAFKKLLKRKEVVKICKGFIKSIEVTRGKDGNPHPHLHVTLAVNKSYFTDATYIRHGKWVDLWRDCLKIDYDPIVSVKRVKDRRKNKKNIGEKIEEDLASALYETVKYSVKPADLVKAEGFESNSEREKYKEFLYGLTEQIRGMRFLEAGGVFRGIFKGKDKSEDISENEMLLKNGNGEETDRIFVFGWNGKKNYIFDKEI